MAGRVRVPYSAHYEDGPPGGQRRLRQSTRVRGPRISSTQRAVEFARVALSALGPHPLFGGERCVYRGARFLLPNREGL